jgi:tetratricopeptide (TPR) repeat protein
MATRRNTRKKEETIVDIVEAKEQAQDFFERNQLAVLGVLAVIVVIIGGYFIYNNLYKMPRNDKAMAQMFQAQFQFEKDSFALSLDNPGGGYEGFLDIIDNYNGTKAANLAKYYAGISYLNLGRFEAAIDFLKDFKPSGEITPIMKFGALGDAYSEINDFERAKDFYKKASNIENDFLTPYYLQKLGMLYEKEGDKEACLKAYSEIKEKYPSSTVGRDIDKFITRAELR